MASRPAMPDVPPDWEAKESKEHGGRVVYINHTTKTTQWERPVVAAKILPPVTTTPGAQAPAGTSPIDQPGVAAAEDSFPSSLSKRTTSFGATYYGPRITKNTDWERSVAPAAPQAPPAPSRSTPEDVTTLELAIRSGDPQAVGALLGGMSVEERVKQLTTTYENEWKVGYPIFHAAETGSVEMFSEVFNATKNNVTESDQLKGIFTGGFRDCSLLEQVVMLGNSSLLKDALKWVRDKLTDREAVDKLSASFETFARCSISRDDAWGGEMLRLLLENYAVPSCRALCNLSREKSEDWLEQHLLGAVTCAENPFIPGMILSVALSEAAKTAPEGDRKKLIFVQRGVDTLLLEILERLPKTVQGFGAMLIKMRSAGRTQMSEFGDTLETVKEGWRGCSALFEPVGGAEDSAGFRGPLNMGFRAREHVEQICAMPLVMDFLDMKFAMQSPDSWTNSLSSRYRVLQTVKILQGKTPYGRSKDYGARDGFLTFLPFLQHSVAEMVNSPNTLYRLPFFRMVFDCLVYLGMLSVFGILVLFHEDGPLTPEEIVFAVYLAGGIVTECRAAMKDFAFYVEHPWNILDVLALVIALIGLLFRCFDNESSWGRGLYALSAPLMFSRLLFFAQIFRFQGPMIQVVSRMVADFCRFALIMFVVMLGFVTSFFALFREINSYGETWLNLFKAMLGEVGFFDDFSSGPDYDPADNVVATVLLVAYLIVMTILLMNLLIAVLSASHSRVNAELEYKVSKAYLVRHYALVVKDDALPSPFNVVQQVASVWCWPFSRQAVDATREAAGVACFWFVLSPVLVTAGVLLWMTSSLFCAVKYNSDVSYRTRSGGLKASGAIIIWCVVGAPLLLVFWWMATPVVWFMSRLYSLGDWSFATCTRRRGAAACAQQCCVSAGIQQPPFSVNDMLVAATSHGVTVVELQKFLKDPISDPRVRQNEKDRPTTVEHIKLLRCFLDGRFEELHDSLHGRLTEMEQRLKIRRISSW